MQRSPPARRLSATNERAYRCRASQPQIENDRKPTGGRCIDPLPSGKTPCWTRINCPTGQHQRPVLPGIGFHFHVGGTRSPFGTDQMAAAGLHAGVSIHSTTGASTRVRLSPTHTIVVFTRATASVTCTAATRGDQRASDGRTPAAAQPRALAPVPQSGVQPPPAHGTRCPGEQEARALGPASHMEARAPDAHRPRCARLPHSARSSALCAAHRPGTRPDCVQYQSDLRGACGPQDGCKLTKNIVPGCHLAPVFFRVPFGVSLTFGLP